MYLSPLWRLLEERVFGLPSSPSLFNFYRDERPELDLPGAAATRRENLRAYLASYTKLPRVLLVGEAPGPWGCRFSGVPFTSENMLPDGRLPFSGRKTYGGQQPLIERSAKTFWSTLRHHHPDFLVWNSLPWHPHKPGQPLTIRAPNISELEGHSDILAAFVDCLQPQQLVAIGRKAELTLSRLGYQAMYVRHPSHGGKREFERAMAGLFAN